jgi:dTDP-4-dehydrorhamnose reductase
VRIVITGAGGGLGRAFLRHVPLHHDIHAFGHADLDITDHHAVMQTVVPLQPDLVINAAAMTAVDACEADPDQAFAANALGPQSLAIAARDSGATLLHVSTDYVFDGEKGAPYDEADRPAPISVYGRSKLAGEENVRAVLNDHVIVRTAWVFGGGNDFASKALAKLRAGEKVQAFTDRVGSPTYVHHLAERLLPLVLAGRPGTYHVAGPEPITWFDAATRLKALGGLPGDVEPATLDSNPLPAPRPRFSALSSVYTHHLRLSPVPPLEVAFKDMLEQGDFPS